MTLDASDIQEFAELGVRFAGQAPQDEEDDDACRVWDINWDSLEAFLDCATQWRLVAGLSGVHRLGLDYAGVDVLLRRRGAPDRVFEDLCVMERAALQALDEMAELG